MITFQNIIQTSNINMQMDLCLFSFTAVFPSALLSLLVFIGCFFFPEATESPGLVLVQHVFDWTAHYFIKATGDLNKFQFILKDVRFSFGKPRTFGLCTVIIPGEDILIHSVFQGATQLLISVVFHKAFVKTLCSLRMETQWEYQLCAL